MKMHMKIRIGKNIQFLILMQSIKDDIVIDVQNMSGNLKNKVFEFIHYNTFPNYLC